MSKASAVLRAGRPSASSPRKKLADLGDDIPMKRVNFDISVENHAKLKIYAAREGKSIKDVLNEFVEQLPK